MTVADKRLDIAATASGRQAAGINLPDWPAYCHEPMPAVEPKPGEVVWGTQRRWEIVRESENRRIAYCAGYYGDIKARYAGGKEQG